MSQLKKQFQQPNSLPSKWIDLLFIRFQGIWANKWASQFPNEKLLKIAKHEWGTALYGFGADHIKVAIESCKKNSEWPPSIAEFVSICESQAGIPDCDKAFELAIRREFVHPVIEKAFNQIGSWDFSRQSEKNLRPRFNEAYQNALHEERIKRADAKELEFIEQE